MTSSDVSRETKDMLRHYAALLEKWTRKINLIAPSTVPDLWKRHILDSWDAVKKPGHVSGHWVDLGSGGGLPGLVAAIVHRADLDTCTLIESDQRKCSFLRTVVRELGLNTRVLPQRIEDVSINLPDLVSARALAPLDKLLDLTAAHHSSGCRFLFMKGRTWKEEVANAEDEFSFVLEVFPSVTDTGSATLLISNVQRRIHD